MDKSHIGTDIHIHDLKVVAIQNHFFILTFIKKRMQYQITNNYYSKFEKMKEFLEVKKFILTNLKEKDEVHNF